MKASIWSCRPQVAGSRTPDTETNCGSGTDRVQAAKHRGDELQRECKNSSDILPLRLQTTTEYSPLPGPQFTASELMSDTESDDYGRSEILCVENSKQQIKRPGEDKQRTERQRYRGGLVNNTLTPAMGKQPDNPIKEPKQNSPPL